MSHLSGDSAVGFGPELYLPLNGHAGNGIDLESVKYTLSAWQQRRRKLRPDSSMTKSPPLN